MNKYTNIFSVELLSTMLLYNNKITKDATTEEVYSIFDKWLEKNKVFRKELGTLKEEEVKEYIHIIKSELDLCKGKSDVFFPFDSIKIYLKNYIRTIQPKDKSKFDMALETIKETNNTKKLTPLSFSDFMAREDKKEYYIKNMFAKGTINMVFSPPASMKSFVSYYMGLCMATGTPFLNQKTKKVNVCYFDWENPLSDIQNRVKGICDGMNLDQSKIDNFFFFPKQPTLLTVTSYDSYVLDELKDQLINFIKDNDIKVIFFDTLRRLGNFDENDSKAINTIKSELFDPLINECEVCVIFLHHTSKEGKNYRGSVDIEGILDTSFSVEKKIKDDIINLKIKNQKRRNNELELLSAVVEIENIGYEDEDGEMLEYIETVKFSRSEEKEEVNEDTGYSNYRTYFIENLKIGTKYKNKDFIEIIETNFGIKKVTANKIIKWLVGINVLKDFGQNKNKYYILNPIHATKDEEIQLKELDIHFKELFTKNEAVEIELLKGKFEEKYYSLIVADWSKRGWVNPAKGGYLIITEQFKLENLELETTSEEVSLT